MMSIKEMVNIENRVMEQCVENWGLEFPTFYEHNYYNHVMNADVGIDFKEESNGMGY